MYITDSATSTYAEEHTARGNTLRNIGIAAALCATLTLPLMAGCDNSASATSADTDSQSTAPASATAFDPSDEGTLASSSMQADELEAELGVPEDVEMFDYSADLDDNGMWKGVRALDYVTLGTYSGIEVPRDQAEATEEEIQSQVDSILAYYVTTNQVTDRAVADGDTINIDYVGKIDGVAFEGGSTYMTDEEGNEVAAGTTVTIGVTQYIDDFLEQLVGHMPGETFDIEVTFPDDYHAAELAGKDAVFTVTINYIEEEVTPELTDEWVAENLAPYYGWMTVDQMTAEIATTLGTNKIQTFVQDSVLASSEVSEVPESVRQYQVSSLVDYYQGYANMYGMTLEDLLPLIAGVSSVDELVAANAEGIQDACESALVVQAIVEQEGFTASDEDVKNYFIDVMGTDDYTSYADTYGMPYLRLLTLTKQVVDYMVSNSVIVD